MLLKLAAIFAVIGVGWGAGRTRILGPDALDTVSRLGFNVFTPALLFRTTAGVSLAALPWPMLAAYFGASVGLLLAAVAGQRLRRAEPGPAAAVRGLAVTFSNTVQLGIPVVTALFGPPGLAVLIAIISLHALVLLTAGTVLAETALSRAPDPSSVRLRARVAQTARRSLVHPVVLPILLGLAYHGTGWPIPGVVDDGLVTLSAAVVPVSLVTIGLSLQRYGVRGSVRAAAGLAALKLLVHPAIVFAVAAGLFGLRGLPLVVAVLCAGLPSGANVLLFANRYAVLEPETTATIVIATLGFAVTGSLWLLILTPHLR